MTSHEQELIDAIRMIVRHWSGNRLAESVNNARRVADRAAREIRKEDKATASAESKEHKCICAGCGNEHNTRD